jgi:hypothetical protein
MMMWGQLPSLAMTLSRSMVSTFPTMSSSVLGRCCVHTESGWLLLVEREKRETRFVRVREGILSAAWTP